MKRFVLVMVLWLVLVIALCGAFTQQGDPETGEKPGAERAKREKMQDTKQLEVGDVAPTFKLKSLDGKEETDLEKFKGKKPVVLFFGSYS